MSGPECSQEICAGDKEENMIREAMNKKAQGGGAMMSYQMKSRKNQVLTNNKPLNAVILGRVTWPLLHRMSLAYPEKPTDIEKKKMLSFIHAFSWMFPCIVCATDFRDKIVEHPPQVESREDLALWFCQQHNLVNAKLGKEEFKCTMRRIQMMHGFNNIDQKIAAKASEVRQQRWSQLD